MPSQQLSEQPTATPSQQLSGQPTTMPSQQISGQPTALPSQQFSEQPTNSPTTGTFNHDCIVPGGIEGGDIAQIANINSAADCQMLCYENAECQWFAWRSDDLGCRLKSEHGGRTWGQVRDNVFHGPKKCNIEGDEE